MRAAAMSRWIVFPLGLALAGGCGGQATDAASSRDPLTGLDDGTPPSASVEVVCLVDADGSVPRLIAEGAWPAWSPDGRRLAVHRLPAGRMSPRRRAALGEIYVVDVAGEGRERLVVHGMEPAWSPDGGRIAFAGEEGIAVVDVDGGAATTLLRHDFLDYTHPGWAMGVGKPAWSPDGKRIALEHRGDGDIIPAQVFVMESDGSDPRRVTPVTGRQHAESDPAWSPDGTRLAFWSYGFGITSLSWPGGEPESLFGTSSRVIYGAKPAWSPDGERIAFTAAESRACTDGRCRQVLAIPASGGGSSPLVEDGYHATWSPDGRRLVFVSADACGGAGGSP